jgi:hypothetical protein
LLLLLPGVASAQVHWDAGLSAGAMQRFTTGRAPGFPFPVPGPTGELNAHIAILPLLRLGPYVSYDLSPFAGANAPPAREFVEGGLRAKLSPPLLRPPWRTWVFAGIGYAGVYEPSHQVPGGRPSAPGEGGGILDARLGLGIGYHLSRTWALFAELGGRAGIFFTGSLYERPIQPVVLNYALQPAQCAGPCAGKDSFALSLSLGLSLNQ